MFYLDGIAIVLSGMEDLELLIHLFNYSLHIYFLSIYYVSDCILGTGNIAVTKTDMVPSHM